MVEIDVHCGHSRAAFALIKPPRKNTLDAAPVGRARE
jgi:hypothetical protein